MEKPLNDPFKEIMDEVRKNKKRSLGQVRIANRMAMGKLLSSLDAKSKGMPDLIIGEQKKKKK